MKINIYINNKPIAEYSPQELEKIGKELNRTAFIAAGYEKVQGAEK